jgi:hypothetical protein
MFKMSEQLAIWLDLTGLDDLVLVSPENVLVLLPNNHNFVFKARLQSSPVNTLNTLLYNDLRRSRSYA